MITALKSGKTMYEALGVRRDALMEQIKSAFRRLAKELRPDLNISLVSTLRFTEEVLPAYQVLRDPERRKAYDAQLGEAQRDHGYCNNHTAAQNGGAKETAKEHASSHSGRTASHDAYVAAKAARSEKVLEQTMSHIRLYGARSSTYDTRRALTELGSMGAISQASILTAELKDRLEHDAIKSIRERGAILAESDVRHALESLDEMHASSQAIRLRSVWSKALVEHVARSVKLSGVYGINATKLNAEYAVRVLEELGKNAEAREVERMYESALATASA